MSNEFLPNDWQGWLKMALYACIAAIGGMLGYIMRNIDKGEKIKWVRVAVEGFASGFVGVIVLLMCQAIPLGEQWTGVIVGVSGWLGANASIRLLETMVYKKLGINKSAPVEEDHANSNKDVS